MSSSGHRPSTKLRYLLLVMSLNVGVETSTESTAPGLGFVGLIGGLAHDWFTPDDLAR